MKDKWTAMHTDRHRESMLVQWSIILAKLVHRWHGKYNLVGDDLLKMWAELNEQLIA